MAREHSEEFWAEYDVDKVDEVALAVLSLTMWTEQTGESRAWKGFDWDVLDRLCEKGWLRNPISRSKSLVLTDEGARLALELRERLLGRKQAEPEG